MAQKIDKAAVCARFGENLRSLRCQARMSQEELAERSGLDRTYISGAERGKRNVSLAAIAQIARALAVPAADLVSAVETTSSERDGA